jgi:hypothetical protein
VAETSSSAIIKFYETSDQGIQIHSLNAGVQHTDILHDSKDILYYNINVSLDKGKAGTVSVDLVPLKGHFVIFASRNGKLPTRKNNEILTENDHLELLYDNYEDHHEYLIGVQSLSNKGKNLKFKITLSYSNKIVKLVPSTISNFTSNESNFYLI